MKITEFWRNKCTKRKIVICVNVYFKVHNPSFCTKTNTTINIKIAETNIKVATLT